MTAAAVIPPCPTRAACDRDYCGPADCSCPPCACLACQTRTARALRGPALGPPRRHLELVITEPESLF